MSNKPLIWKLSDADFKEIDNLYEKKRALENLLRVDGIEKQSIYDRAVEDLESTNRLFDAWWDDKSHAYNWEGQSWYVDFVRQGIVRNDNEN